MTLSIIVAAAENNVIGNHNQLIWKLSADLRHFKTLTTGHPVIMGRKTFESIGRALPNRRNIVISSNPEFQAIGCERAANLQTALELVKNTNEVFIIGGGMLYKEAWPLAHRLYLTRVHATPEGDTYIPIIREEEWQEKKREDHQADEKNEYDYSFIDYQRKL